LKGVIQVPHQAINIHPAHQQHTERVKDRTAKVAGHENIRQHQSTWKPKNQARRNTKTKINSR
jgi:hypothetical protein